jgi:GNAT superfamily N-acetyltransferase
MNTSELRFLRGKGPAVAPLFDALAALRIAVFRDFPYLYEGTMAYEKEYLQTYARSERALLFAVYHEGRMVGATTCIPLADETPEVQKPFIDAGYSLSDVFYFGESILLPEYRGLGLGHRFFDEREAHAASFGTYKHTCFCAVVRPGDHPSRPASYRPLDAFWIARGYRKMPELQSEFSWPDIGTTISTPKPMVYWMRSVV